MIDFKIVKPEGIVYEDLIEKVTIPTMDGEITVLPEHLPLVSVLSTGVITIHKKDFEVDLAVSGGILEIRPDSKVYIMADSAERAEDIDLERAEQARQRAEKLLKEENKIDDIEFAKLQAIIEREMNRIRLGKKYKKLN
ncbi:MAG: ATP synthase F1 subunit epsilon [Patescibacteria group bacterium]